MIQCLRMISLGMFLFLAIGCDTGERISRLEKQTQELKAEVAKDRVAADYDLQAKCSRDAKGWFKENWTADKSTMLLEYNNHYNKASNKCFVFVEYHFSFGPTGSWINNMTLWDVYENSKYGDFGESTTIFLKPPYESKSSVSTCVVLGNKCTTVEEFNNLVRPYLNN
jgi:hypothetical protein